MTNLKRIPASGLALKPALVALRYILAIIDEVVFRDREQKSRIMPLRRMFSKLSQDFDFSSRKREEGTGRCCRIHASHETFRLVHISTIPMSALVSFR